MEIKVSLNNDNGKKAPAKVEKVINYTELRTLKNKKPQKLLPGLASGSHSFIHKKTCKTDRVFQQETDEPKLLRTAVSMIKKKYEQNENIQIDNNSHNGLGLSNYFNSRQITPINPLGGHLINSSYISKKRMKTHQTNKSRLQSITSDLHEMQSQGESVANLLPAYKQKDFKLYDRVLGQSEAAYHYAFGKQKKIPQKLIYQWQQCLLHEDKTEIFVPMNPEDSNNIRYTHPRIFPLNELEKGFDQVYGSGKHRCLKAGQEALIIESIRKYISKCNDEPMKIARKDYDIIADILADCKLSELQNYPMCYRQIQAHFKIMATRWKFENIDNKTNRMIQPAIINGKNNFVDLGKIGILSDYLLKHSNKNEFL